MSDDGEPSGTAGKPILFALQRAQLSDVLLVVVRYYGGVKLGVGPLARAYADAAQLAIDACQRVIVRDMSQLTVFCMYDDVSTVTRTLEEYDSTFTASYSDAITFDVTVATELCEALIDTITTRTNARAGALKVSTE
jgi:putative IMPACT (imprinted ancient) family translation regulator